MKPTRGSLLELMLEVAALINLNLMQVSLESRDLARRLGAYFGVPEAGDVVDECGLSGAVVVAADVLQESAPPGLLALAVSILAGYNYTAPWHGFREQAVEAARARMAQGMTKPLPDPAVLRTPPVACAQATFLLRTYGLPRGLVLPRVPS